MNQFFYKPGNILGDKTSKTVMQCTVKKNKGHYDPYHAAISWEIVE